jgi:hypothetical protein
LIVSLLAPADFRCERRAAFAHVAGKMRRGRSRSRNKSIAAEASRSTLLLFLASPSHARRTAPSSHYRMHAEVRRGISFLWEIGDASEPPGKPWGNQNRHLTLLPAIGAPATAAVTPGGEKAMVSKHLLF